MSRATSVINGRVMIQYEGSGVPSQISRWPTTTFPLSLLLSLFLLHLSSVSPPLIARPLETNGTPAAKLLLLTSTLDGFVPLVLPLLAPLARKRIFANLCVYRVLARSIAQTTPLLFSGIGFSQLPVAKVAFRGLLTGDFLGDG